MIILCYATLTIFALRINVSVAALKMSEELRWTATETGNVLSSLYYGYTAGQIPSIILAEKHGGSRALGVSVGASTLINILIPFASRVSIKWTYILQIMMGFFQAGCFPACYHLYPRWMPTSERTIMVAFVVTGVYMVQL
jgi:sugar phosphate permease